MEGPATLPLPEDPALAAMAAALRDAGHWAEIVDRDWHQVCSTDDLRRIYDRTLAHWQDSATFGERRCTAAVSDS